MAVLTTPGYMLSYITYTYMSSINYFPDLTGPDFPFFPRGRKGVTNSPQSEWERLVEDDNAYLHWVPREDTDTGDEEKEPEPLFVKFSHTHSSREEEEEEHSEDEVECFVEVCVSHWKM